MPRIAVVNDDTAFLALMTELLTDQGYTVLPHHEGDTAYDLIRREQPQLVILDLRLPDPTAGWQVLELLRLDLMTRDIPVIICSADAVALRAKEGMLRAQGYVPLEKPFDLETLLALVRQRIAPPTSSAS